MRRAFMTRGVRAFLTTAATAAAVALVPMGLAADNVASYSSTSSDVIKWRSGVVTTTGAAAADAAGALSSAAAGGRRVVVQFNAPLTAAQQAALDVAGVKLLSYLSNNAYFARVDAARFDAAAVAASTLKTALPVELGWKLSPILMADQVPGWSIVAAAKQPDSKDDPAVNELHAIDDDMIVAVYAMFHKDVDLNAEAVPLAVRYGASVVGSLQGAHALVLELPATAIKPLTGEDALLWIEPPLPRFEELNDSNRARVQANQLQGAPYGLDGTGVGVLVYDGGKVRATHQDFGGRVTLGVGDASPQSSHSTHVAGTIGGSGAASAGLRKGMAPNVSIVSYGLEQVGGLHQGFLYNDPCDIEADYGNAINTYDAHIANNSIGTNTSTNGYPCTWQGDYGVTDTVIDAIVRGSVSGGVPFRIVWANGNERQSTRCQNLPPPFQQYHLTAPPACAKNHIAVGALNSNDDSMTTFSSWGPADDGRLKPDISAPGCESGGDAGVTSCSSSSDTAYASLCGTSMASPTTCGVGALLLQDFRAQFPGEPDFRNSTLKILLAHTAVDLGTPGPDFQFGYGSIRGQAAVDFMRTGNFAENSVPGTGNSVNYVVVVQPGDTLMKVTIAWDDPPGTPNVSPALVNDLDLVVTSPGGTRFYPWTHGGLANPAAAAVQTQENHLDNIEQVLVNNPQVGSWQIEVRGTAVPSGPQPFSIAAGPFLVNCSSIGSISLNADEYNCSSSATLRVVDCDLNTDAGAIETVNVTINSTSEPAGETVLLTEVAPDGATFVGTISLSTTNAAGVLHIAHADTVTATYLDASDGQGGFNILRTDTATVDCVGPIISNVQVINLAAHSATVTFNTDEAAKGTVRYGTSCGALTSSVVEAGFTTSHTLNISGLTDNTTYFFAVDAADPGNNSSSDDNGGSCYTFTTPEIPDYFTELFAAGETNDTDNTMFTFSPNGTFEAYTACKEAISALPTDPTSHAVITFTNGDDGAFQLTVGSGQSVKLYGVSYTTLWAGTNGYVTFTASDTSFTESLTDHFDTPEIAMCFDDLEPRDNGGSVRWAQLADRFVVTWLIVPEYSASTPNPNGPNTGQIEMFFDGTIRISYLTMTAVDGLVGLSRGGNVPADFFESDFSTYGPCVLLGDMNCDGEVNILDINAFTLAISDPVAYAAAYPGCNINNGDINDDGNVDVLDINPFIALLGG
ncbi:Serine protease AprX [Phycisphaerae bacterium RAS1]|nr:Serine protease AprX [Phycisphaerae bacterium RAS1]